MSLPILGTYDSYGAVDNIAEGPLERQLVSHLRGLYDGGELRLSGDRFPDSLEHLLRYAERGLATAKLSPAAGGGAPLRADMRELVLSLMFVDSRVYQAVVALVRESRGWEAQWRVGGPRGPKDAQAAMAQICASNGNLAFYCPGSDVTTELLERMGDLHDFELALRLLRRCYTPPTGAGSQSTAYAFHAGTAAVIRRIALEDGADEQ
jgi:hypothetical protein